MTVQGKAAPVVADNTLAEQAQVPAGQSDRCRGRDGRQRQCTYRVAESGSTTTQQLGCKRQSGGRQAQRRSNGTPRTASPESSAAHHQGSADTEVFGRGQASDRRFGDGLFEETPRDVPSAGDAGSCVHGRVSRFDHPCWTDDRWNSKLCSNCSIMSAPAEN